MLLPGGDALGAGAPCPLSGSGQDVRSAEPCRLAAFSDGSVRPALFSPQFACKHALHTRGISRARSFDLEVKPWAPTRLTSCIFHPGPAESSGASTLEPGPAQQFRSVKFPPSRPASLSARARRRNPSKVAGGGQRLGEDPTNRAHIRRRRLEWPCGRAAPDDPARRAASSSFGAQIPCDATRRK